MPAPVPRRPGPVYDDAMKILAEDDLGAVLSVVGVTGPAEPLDPSPVSVELPASARKADLVASTPDGLVHVEFVKDPAPDLDLRMVEYRLRLRRRDREAPLRQFALVLRDITVASSFIDPGPDHFTAHWTVVHLDRADPEKLLAGGPTTAALAALGHGDAAIRARVLTAARRVIGREPDRDRRDVLMGAATTLASITLSPRVIMESVKEEAAMPVPIKETPLGEYLMEEGRAEGEHAAVVRFTRALLRRRFGEDPRLDGVALRLADLPEDDRVARILDAPDLASLI